MSPRNYCLGLTSFVALLFAVAAQAGEITMDVRGYSAETEQIPDSTRMRSDEAPITEVDSRRVESKTRIRPKWHNVTSSPDQALLTDRIDTDAATPSDSTSGSSSSSISVPAKPRNRWQSLVPGAIK